MSALRGLPTLRSFRIEEPAAAEVDARSADTLRISLDVFHLYGRFGGRTNRTECIGLIAILGVGFLAVDSGAVTVGQVTTAALFFHRLFNPIGVLLFLFDDLPVTAASLTRLVGVAAPPGPVVRRPGGAGRGTAGAQRDRPPLPAGASRAGPRRPGRGTRSAGRPDRRERGGQDHARARSRPGCSRPRPGPVRLGPVDLETLDPALLRRQVGLVSQEVHVFAGTVRENLLLPAASTPPPSSTRH